MHIYSTSSMLIQRAHGSSNLSRHGSDHNLKKNETWCWYITINCKKHTWGDYPTVADDRTGNAEVAISKPVCN